MQPGIRLNSVWLLMALATAAPQGQAQSAIEEVRYEVLDTKLEQTAQPSEWTHGRSGLWLDDSRLLVGALQDQHDAPVKRSRRVVLYDVRDRSVKTLIASGTLYCFNADNRIAAVEVDGDMRHVHISDAGELLALDKPAPYPPRLCRVQEPPNQERLKGFLRGQDGYIDRGRTGKGASADDALLYRPGLPPQGLPVAGGEVDAIPEYLPFLNKYLLSRSNPRTQAERDRPYRLMSPDGAVSEIPYPRKLAELLPVPFGIAIMMKPGLVLARAGKGPGGGGFVLVQGERFVRFWGDNGDFVMSHAVSPDGCKLAFMSYGTRLVGESAKTVKIIDVCEGAGSERRPG